MASNTIIPMLVSILLLITGFVHSTPVRRDTSPGQCAMPTTLQLSERLLQSGSHSSFEPMFGVASYSTVNNFSCPTTATIDDAMTVNVRSTCPWVYEQDVNPNRIPRVINKAVCNCRKCIKPDEGSLIPDSHCTRVNYTLKVLKRTGCVDGTYIYEVDFESVPVACSCNRPVTPQG